MFIIDSIASQFHQLSVVIEQLSAEEYKMPIDALSNATIGKHTRHIIEHFLQLNVGYTSAEINYDHRCRNKELEENKLTALTTIWNIKSELYKPDKQMTLATDDDINVTTTYYRELLFNLSHVTHHMAQIRIGVKDIKSLSIPEGFGIAASTLKYRKQSSRMNKFHVVYLLAYFLCFAFMVASLVWFFMHHSEVWKKLLPG